MARLEWSVRALSQAAHDQIALYPDSAVVADELALDFDSSLRVARQFGLNWSEEQRASLDALDSQLEAMSDLHDRNLWSNEALASHSAWGAVRQLAAVAVARFGWSTEPPPHSPDDHVPANPQSNIQTAA
jgi:hypothetical protein